MICHPDHKFASKDFTVCIIYCMTLIPQQLIWTFLRCPANMAKWLVSAVFGLEDQYGAGRQKTGGFHKSEITFSFCIRSSTDGFHPQSVWARGRWFFSSHHSARGNESTSVADWDGFSCKWLRFCTLIHTPGASDYLQVGGTNFNTQLNHGWPQSTRSTDPLEWEINHSSKWKVDTSLCKTKNFFLLIALWIGAISES